jgi:hypothetical protein
MKRFGQEVFLTIESADGTPILDAAGLRIDFDVKQIQGFSRASVVIYNLNDETIGNLIGGNQDHFATLTTRLHGGNEFILMDGFYISNSIDHKVLPDTITTLYLYSGVKKRYLENQVATTAKTSSLAAQLKTLKVAATFPGEFILKSFPADYDKFIPPRGPSPMTGSMGEVLEQLGKENNFKSFTVGEDILIQYLPDLSQVPLTDLDTREFITLDTNNMRANPKLSPAQLQINSNLDGSIVPGAVVDITQLLTAEIGSDEQTLQIADNFAQTAVSGYKRFQVIEVTHKGSNYTGSWNTMADCIAPKRGATAPVGRSWFKRQGE